MPKHLMKYLTTDEVAELCRTSPETVRFWHWQGRGPKSVKIGRRRLYATEDVEAWIEEASSGSAA